MATYPSRGGRPGAGLLQAYVDAAANPFGFPYTVDPGQIRHGATDAVNIASGAAYGRVLGAGTISKIGLGIGTQSGNISLAVYANSGTGRAAVPGTRLATSGAVACPATGYQEVALGASVTVTPGDWFCITADNATATFWSNLAQQADSDIGKGRQYRQAVHPAPTTPGSLVAVIGYSVVLIGVA